MARFRARGVPRSSTTFLVLLIATAGCAPTPTPTDGSPPAGSASPQGSAAPVPSSTPVETRTLGAASSDDAAVALAAGIVDVADITAAYTATADVLARAGIRIETPTHVYVEAVAPATGTSMWPRQVLSAALEGQNRRFVHRISARDAGTIAAAMGLTLPGATGDAADAWLALVRAWLQDAKASPDDPTSFAPLFAAEMVRLGDGVDLATAPTSDVRFGLLELLVLTAGFQRADTTTASVQLAVAHTIPNSGSAEALLEGPCDATLDRYGIPPNISIVPGEPPAWMRKQAVGQLTGLSSEATQNILKVVESFGKIWKAAAFYFYSFVRVESIDKRLHKPNEEQADLFTTFTAKAGVDPDAFKAWVKDHGGPNGVREMGDDLRCAEALGLPTLVDVGDVAADSANWIVEWEPLAGTPEHAELAEPCGSAPTASCNSYDRHQPVLGMKLRNTGGSVSQADLYVRIKEEKKSIHGIAGTTEAETPLTVRASVDSSTMPSISPGDLTSPSGLIGPGLETIVGLVQSAFKPSSTATMIITYHRPGQLVTESTVAPLTWYGLRCDVDDPEWLVRGEATAAGYTEQWLYDATIDPLTMTGTYKYEAIGTIAGGTLTKNGSGKATIERQPDDSVIMRVDEITVKGTITAGGTTQSVSYQVPATSFTFKPAATTRCPS